MSSRPATTNPDDNPGSLVQVFIALGSNLPTSAASSAQNVRNAMDRISSWSAAPPLRSSLWVSAPEDCPPGSNNFVNAVIGLYLDERARPESLLEQTQVLEKEFGRDTSHARNAPRTLDLDLIAFGNERCDTPQLVLPHPRAHERGFVLYPLAEIAPGYTLPGMSATVTELARLCAEPSVLAN